MYPLLFSFGSFQLYTYGLMMALGVLAGLFVVDAEAKRLGWNREKMTRLVVYVFLMGLVGSRLVYVMTRMGDANVNILAVLFNLRAGFVYYGGLIASWVFLVVYLKKNRMPFWSVSDAFAMAICIGLAVGRIGCLLGGCCFGTPTSLPWGVVMVNDAALGHLHPVQAYEFLFLIVLFLVLWMRRSKRKYEGELVVWFVGAYAIARYILEFWRGDGIRGFLIEDVLSTSQFISLPMLAVAVGLHIVLKKKN